ncbi:MAG: TonB-dependent receptor domain-containing protein [Sphingomonadales bacterium]
MTGILCCISLLLSAPDTFPASDTAVIHGKRHQVASVGKNVIHIESGSGNLLNQDLASAGLSIRQYGPSGIGTLSRRGADPAQLQILWNGIVLNNPMLGMTDLSLLQNDASTRISLTEGSSGSLYGSGSVGGTLALQHAHPVKMGEHVSASFLTGSFGRMQAHGDFGIRKRRSYLVWDNQWFQINNDFPYKIGNENAGKMQFAVRDQLRSRISAGFHLKKWDFGAHAEWQNGSRGLGTSAGGTTSLGNQDDENRRLALHANYHTNKIKWVQRFGVIDDRIIFQMPGNGTQDSSRSQSVQLQQELHFHIGKWNAIAGADLWRVTGNTRQYARSIEQVFPAQFVALYRQSRNYRIAASSRWEWHEQIAVNSLSAEYAINKALTAKAAISNSFRRPTLNDQYWSFGGNPNLRPESGGNAEAGVVAGYISGRIKFDFSATLWARYLDNPIVWLPENNIWSARNMQRGDYHGFQFSTRATGELGKVRWLWQTGVEWCKTSMLNNNHRFHALFVPRLSGATSLKLSRKRWFFHASGQWQSRRYTSTDNLSSLPGYGLLSMQTGHNLAYRHHAMVFSAGADNILNQDYEVMPGRPMPLRSFWLKVNMQINKNNEK